jgi:hypothetical protein
MKAVALRRCSSAAVYMVADAYSLSEQSQQKQARRMRHRTSPRWWRRGFSPPFLLSLLPAAKASAPIRSWSGGDVSSVENRQKYREDVENTLQLAAPRVMDVLLYIERVRIE